MRAAAAADDGQTGRFETLITPSYLGRPGHAMSYDLGNLGLAGDKKKKNTILYAAIGAVAVVVVLVLVWVFVL